MKRKASIIKELKDLSSAASALKGGSAVDKHVLTSLAASSDLGAVEESEAAPNTPPSPGAAVADSSDSTVVISTAPETAPDDPDAVDLATIQSESKQAIQELRQSLEQEIIEIQTVHRTELDALRQQLSDSESRNNRLESLFKLSGTPTPVTKSEAHGAGSNVNTSISRPDMVDGAFAEFQSIYKSADKITKYGRERASFVGYDTREIRLFVRKNRSALIQSLEDWGKRNGLFKGTSGRISKQAATTRFDLDGAFFVGLSALMRDTNRPGYIFWQFPTVKIEFEKGMGDTIAIARSDFLPKPTSVDSRRLSGGGTFVDIDPGSQRLMTGVVNAILEEWGLGADAQNRAVGIPTFVQSYSMIALMQVLQDNLLEDYWCWEDMGIRDLWMPTSRVIYNRGSEPETDPTALVVGSDGTFTENFASNLHAYAQTQLIKPFSDGCYGFAMPTQVLRNYRNSLSINDRWQAPTTKDLQDLLNILNTDYIGEADRITGYAGKYSNLHLFSTNAYGVGAPGTEGVATETTGAGAQTFRKSFLFGRNSIARGIGSEMEILMESGAFNRIQRAIWLEESAFVPLDVDPIGYGQTPGNPGVQQLRVLAVHTTDQPI